MRASVTVQSRFSASHVIEGHPVCGRVHGHAWVVSATVDGPVSPKTGAVDGSSDLATGLAHVIVELDHKHLNDMLPGVVPTPEGIAAWVHERLLLASPRLTSVTVDDGDYAATLVWEIR